eukprot:685451-Rhodomonas_salina.5
MVTLRRSGESQPLSTAVESRWARDLSCTGPKVYIPRGVIQSQFWARSAEDRQGNEQGRALECRCP